MITFLTSRSLRVLIVAIILSGCASIELFEPSEPSDSSKETQPTQTVYNNKTIELIVPFAPGGGTDTWARTIAPFFQKHLGRNNRIQVVNRPGDSGVAGANDFFHNHDPQTILVSAGSIFFPYLLGDSSVAYDFNDLVPILGSPVGGVVFVSPETEIASIRDLCMADKTLYYGGVSASGLDIVSLITFELLGLDVQATFGYDGKGASRVAFEQGKANIEYQTTPGYLSNAVRLTESNAAIPLFSFGILDGQGQVVRDPTFSDLPTIKDVYTACYGVEPTGIAWDVYKATLAAGFTIQKVMWVHEDTPEEAITELRQAAAIAAADPEFSESARNLLGDYDFFVGHEAQVTFAAAFSLSPESIAWLKSLLQEEYGVQF